MFMAMRRAARIGAGMAMLTAGTVMIFTPGPGLLTIAGGLALMKDDVAWAGRAAGWVKQKVSRTPSAPSHDRVG
jgi:hypothetical protein